MKQDQPIPSIHASELNDPKKLEAHLAAKKEHAAKVREEQIRTGKLEVVTQAKPAGAAPPPATENVRTVSSVNFGMHVYGRLAEHIDFKVPAGVVNAMKEWVSKYDLASERLQTFSVAAVKSAYRDSVQAGIDAVMSGEPDRAAGNAFYSRNQVKESKRAEQRALKEGMRAVSMEAARIARPVLTEFAQMLNEEIDAAEKKERDLFKELGLAYQPRELLLQMRFVASTLKTLVPRDEMLSGNNSPRNFLPWLLL